MSEHLFTILSIARSLAAMDEIPSMSLLKRAAAELFEAVAKIQADESTDKEGSPSPDLDPED